MKARVRSWWHGSKVNRHHVGYLLEISDTRALLGKMVDVCEIAMIWPDGRCKPKGTLSWEWMMCNHYLKSQAGIWNNRERLLTIGLREALSSGPGCNLLQPWDSKRNNILFGCVPRVIRHLFQWMLHRGLLQIPRRKCNFHLATFVLRSAWTN
jgi:hypothetical protein